MLPISLSIPGDRLGQALSWVIHNSNTAHTGIIYRYNIWQHAGIRTRDAANTAIVSISSIFPLPNHLSRIFFHDIPNDDKKSLKPLGHMRPVGTGSVPQVKIDGPWNLKMYG